MRLSLIPGLLLPAFLWGCPLGVACTEIAVTSVTVNLVDTDAHPILDADVTYEVDGGDPMPCQAWEGSYACGTEEAGEFVIRAVAAGYQEGEENLVVTEDVCHVDGQVVVIELQPVDCTQEEVVSVIVTVEDETGGLVPDAAVSYVPRDLDWMAPEPCETSDGHTFACGWEYHGIIDLWAEAPGHAPETGEVDVDWDGCHPFTEEFAFVLEAAP
jgi:hypothetical protein